MGMEKTENCRICGSETKIKWPSNLEGELSSTSFAITDSHYGQTSAIYLCSHCGFLQCNELSDVLTYYENLEDLAYVQGRPERYLQSKALVDRLAHYQKSGSLLDVGAGSGILVEAARKAGYDATGLEPSEWLQHEAEKLNLPVKKGVLTDLPEDQHFDIITLIDVIEHVIDPMALLVDIRKRLATQGLCMVVTPDCASWFARFLGRKWWHYRVAHIGYFNQKTLTLACEKAGFEIIAQKRPGWFFTMDYLWVRVMQYLPKWLRLGPFNWMKTITLPINLRDSLLVVLRAKTA